MYARRRAMNREERELFSALKVRIQQEKDVAKLIKLVEEMQALLEKAQAREKDQEEGK